MFRILQQQSILRCGEIIVLLNPDGTVMPTKFRGIWSGVGEVPRMQIWLCTWHWLTIVNMAMNMKIANDNVVHDDAVMSTINQYRDDRVLAWFRELLDSTFVLSCWLSCLKGFIALQESAFVGRTLYNLYSQCYLYRQHRCHVQVAVTVRSIAGFMFPQEKQTGCWTWSQHTSSSPSPPDDNSRQ